ncbi:hypothetical protein ACHHYP_10740 [Achlya hypogyna]|uniref:FYVE-type domain-containing protein n=1 Tax=Achlya hypogyna TaxID=1202772 RepID=A0A1V9ZHS6_ACHHY|nr:hypothetical protein ACHHYP_10740 [Achlya hypogyna]
MRHPTPPVVYQLQHFKNRRNWVLDKHRAHCAVCATAFLLRLRRKHHCRRCGEVVCRSCCQFVAADLPVVGLTKVRVCRTCIVRDIASDTLGVATNMDVLLDYEALYRTTEFILFSPMSCSKVDDHEAFRQRPHPTYIDEDDEEDTSDVTPNAPRRPKWAQFKALLRTLVPSPSF